MTENIIIRVCIGLALLLMYFFIWKKHHSRYYLAYTVLIGLLLLARIVEHGIDATLILSQEHKAIEYYTLTSIRGLALVLFIIIGSKHLLGKNDIEHK